MKHFVPAPPRGGLLSCKLMASFCGNTKQVRGPRVGTIAKPNVNAFEVFIFASEDPVDPQNLRVRKPEVPL